MEKNNDDRVTITIALTREEKRRLRLYAVKRDTSANQIVKEWIRQFCAQADDEQSEEA